MSNKSVRLTIEVEMDSLDLDLLKEILNQVTSHEYMTNYRALTLPSDNATIIGEVKVKQIIKAQKVHFY